MGRTSPIEDVNDADERTNDGKGSLKISSGSSEAAKTARLSNVQKARQGKKRKSSLGLEICHRDFVLVGKHLK